MELLFSISIGALTAAGIYLILRLRTFPVVVGMSFLSYAVNLFLFSSGRLAKNLPPIISKTAEAYTDPLPQALVLTAIVISFGMTAVVVLIALGAFLETDNDEIALPLREPDPDPDEDEPLPPAPAPDLETQG